MLGAARKLYGIFGAASRAYKNFRGKPDGGKNYGKHSRKRKNGSAGIRHRFLRSTGKSADFTPAERRENLLFQSSVLT